jgi:transglutaminase-like putative cysteine protease/predicted glutamine amidotransferase
MPNLLAISFEGALAPSFDLRCLHHGGRLPDGWGIGFYPGGEPSASVLKEPAPRAGSIRSELVKAWEHLESSVFVLHIRTATWGAISDANTQPFVRSYAGRDYLFGHSGSLKHRIAAEAGSPVFEPVGSTDTERVFCELLSRVAAEEKRCLAEVDPDVLLAFFDELSEHGGMTSVLTDGRDLVVYADRKGDGAIYLARVLPPYERVVIGDDDLGADLFKRGTKSRKGIVVASNPLPPEPGVALDWQQIEAGKLLVVREGAIVADAGPSAPAARERPSEPQIVAATREVQRPRVAPARRLWVLHRTSYRYERAVERSSQVLRLTPIHDRLQAVLSHSVELTVDGKARDYDDVFGNRVRRVEIDTPYTDLTITARSVVDLLDTDPLSFRPLHKRWTIPLVWMPWQRHMLQPYLLPEELPDSELEELTEYAMSFVERNDYDLFDTLLDLNATIKREYEYRQGATTNYTTPFDVYTHRHGVCQDFSNLFICIARLLSVPARYVCGYVYTGPKHENVAQGEATHAWVQVYLPEVGWKGFDPTNGVMTQTDHVRVAVGRKRVDATPTAGAVFLGGGRETLSVDVRCEPVEESA